MYNAAFKHPVWKIRTHDLWETPFRRRKPEAYSILPCGSLKFLFM
jgi:hypothetical protein